MGEVEPRWSRRRKRRGRRIAHDLRVFAPLVAIALCLVGSATAIFAAERVFPKSPQPLEIEALADKPQTECRPGK